MKKYFELIAPLAAFFLILNFINLFPALIAHADGAPMFDARIEYDFQGYVVKGTFTEFPPDISLIQPMYSLDGLTWQTCGEPWDLYWLGDESEGALAKLQNQICLYAGNEPLKSYLDNKLDRFYLKLSLTLQDGRTYETQTAAIDRGAPQPIPENLSLSATFAPVMAVYEMRPFCHYGRYQLTVSADATPEDIRSLLPDTIPIEIQLLNGINFVTKGIVDCPVTWKPLSFPRLVAGESVTISDIANEIVVPAGTLLNTPNGVFTLDEPLALNHQYGLTDEIRLVLNVVSKDEEPAIALSAENAGLEIAFSLKPTGATALRAYVWSQDNPVWTELSNLPLLETINAQPSSASSGYTFVLGHDQEPYRSYLAAKTAGEDPVPFFIGMIVEGGVYDGRQKVLTWPDTYDLPLVPPKLDGAGGNEANAGADNKDDSTAKGQRPNLPHNPEDNKKNTTPATPVPDGSSQTGTPPEPYAPGRTGTPPEHAPTGSNAPSADTNSSNTPSTGIADGSNTPSADISDSSNTPSTGIADGSNTSSADINDSRHTLSASAPATGHQPSFGIAMAKKSAPADDIPVAGTVAAAAVIFCIAAIGITMRKRTGRF